MASSSYTLSVPLQLPQYASSARFDLGAGALPSRPSPSARLQTTTTKGQRSVAAATSYQYEAAGNGDNGAATTSALHLVAGDDDAATELRAAARVRGAGLRSPKGPGAPREGSGGSGGKVHAAPPTLLRRLPKEGSGGQGGSIH